MDNIIISKSISSKTNDNDDEIVTEQDRDILIEKLKELREERKKLLPRNKILKSIINRSFDKQMNSDAFAKLNPFRLKEETEENQKLMEEFINFKLTKAMQEKMIKEEIKSQNAEKTVLDENLNDLKKGKKF